MSKQTWIFLLVVTVIMVSVPQFLPQEQKNSYIYNEQRMSKQHPVENNKSKWTRVEPGYSAVCSQNGVTVHVLSPEFKPFECSDENGYIEVRRPQ